jgi:membrane protease YdiL (CAAX protease family)
VIDNDPQIPEGPHEPAAEELHAEQPPARDPIWNYKDLLVVLGLGVPSLVAALVVTGILMFATAARDKNVFLLPAQFFGYLIWFVFVALYLKIKYNVGFWRALGWHWQPGYVMPAILGGVALALTVGITGMLLKTPRIEEGLIQELLKNPITRAMVMISAATIGPVCEELIFRGFLLPLLARTFGAVAGVMLTALPFALLHGPQYKWTWQIVVLIFIAGCAFGWTRLRTGSTATSTVLHAAYNTVFLAPYFFSDKGMDI